MGAPSMGAPSAANAAKVKELISSFLKKPRAELLQCKIHNITLFKDELSVLIALVLCDFCGHPTKRLMKGLVR